MADPTVEPIAPVPQPAETAYDARHIGPWKCFNCGEVFADAAAAAEHFQPDGVGDTDGWPAACVDPMRTDEKERHRELIDAHRDLERERDICFRAETTSRERISTLEAENAKLRAEATLGEGEALRNFIDENRRHDDWLTSEDFREGLDHFLKSRRALLSRLGKRP